MSPAHLDEKGATEMPSPPTSLNCARTAGIDARKSALHAFLKGMRLIAAVAFLFSLSAHAGITERGRGILFGANHAFSITAKSGWVLDNQSGVDQGLHMVFYPVGRTWSDSPVIMYGRAVPTTVAANVKSQVDRTVRGFQTNGSPDYSAEPQAPLTLPGGKTAELYLFSGDQWGNYEAVAYVQETDTINFLVFNARKKEDFDRHFDDFLQMIRSYQNLYTPSTSNTQATWDGLKREAALDLAKPGGKEYEAKAVKGIGQFMANAMRDCTSYPGREDVTAFSYFVRIDDEGNNGGSYIFPTSALSTCFSAWMSSAKYPHHTFGSFVLNIEMKISE